MLMKSRYTFSLILIKGIVMISQEEGIVMISQEVLMPFTPERVETKTWN